MSARPASLALIACLLVPGSLHAGWWDDLMFDFREVFDRELPHERILGFGDPENRVNILISGDGWTADELPEFRQHVQRLTNALFDITPYKEYENMFTVTRIDATSPVSGISQEHPPLTRDTYFKNWMKAKKDSNNQIRVGVPPTHPSWPSRDRPKARKIMDKTNVDLPRNVFVILVNDDNATGGIATSLGSDSGSYTTFGVTGSSNVQVMAHELGHALFNLADEYLAPNSGTRSPPATEPNKPNVTLVCNPTPTNPVKWQHFIDAGVEGIADGPHQGGLYVSTGVCRPKIECMMKSHWTEPFCGVCLEAIGKSIQSNVNLVDVADPEDYSLSINPTGIGEGANYTFKIETVGSSDSRYDVTWYLDQEPVSDEDEGVTMTETESDRGPKYELSLGPEQLTSGRHSVWFTLIDKGTFVEGWDEDRPDIVEERPVHVKVWSVKVRYLSLPFAD